MPSPLDIQIQQGLDAVVGEGKLFQLGEMEQRGQKMPYISNAPENLTHFFAYFCMQHGAAEFLVDGDERLSFADTFVAARQVAQALVERHGIAKGDRVGIAMRNAPGWVVTYMGVLMAGGVAVLLNGWWQGAELAEGIKQVDCRLILADAPRAAVRRPLPPGAARQPESDR